MMMAERIAERLKEIQAERQAKIDRRVEEGWRPGFDKNGRPVLIEPRRRG